MAKVSASEVKRVISAVQNRRVLDFRNRIRPLSSELLANERKLAERITPFLTKGIELEKIDKMVADNQNERRRLLEKEKADAYKRLPRIEDTFRHGIDARFKAVELANLTNVNPPTFIILDTPFLIWAEPSNTLRASHIQPRNSTAKIRYSRDYQEGADSVTVGFYFRWENSSPNSVLLANVNSHLVVKGLWDISANSSSTVVSTNNAYVNANAQLRLFEWWNQPPTSPLTENSQFDDILSLEVEGGVVWQGAGKGQSKYESVFNGYDVKYSSFVVPSKGVVVFEVLLLSFVVVEGDGCTVLIQIEGGDSSVLCPFLQLEVREVIQSGPPLP